MAELAARQHGVVSGGQMRGVVGFTHKQIVRAEERGWIHRLYRDVFAVGHRRLSRRGHELAAVFACGPGALLSHRSAADLWGITTGDHRIEVTGPVRRKHRGELRVHHSTCLVDDDRVSRDRIPLSALPRTLLDLAAMVPARRLESAIETAERLGILDLDPILALLERTRGHHGHGRLRRAIALYVPDPTFTREELERRFVKLIRASPLSMPLINTYQEGYELDAFWPEERFAVELQSYGFHRTRGAFERDFRRLEDLKLAGIEMIPVTWRRLHDDPDSLIANLTRLLAERRRR